LTPRRDIVERAVVKRLFARAARRPVSVPPELADRVENLLADRCCDAIGLARRGGFAVAGFDRVAEALARGRIGLVLVALDGAESGEQRLGAAARAVPTARVLTAAELGGAFGRERIVYAALAAGLLCRRLSLDLVRLAGLRGAAIESGMGFASAAPALAQDGTKNA